MNDLGILPVELIVAIFECLDIPSLLVVSAVSLQSLGHTRLGLTDEFRLVESGGS